MKEGPSIASVAALIGDPARANMLAALMSGRALTAGELAREAGIAAPTASGHLARLREAGLVLVEAQGRHRYVRLAGPEVAAVLEGLMGLSARDGRLRTRPGPRDPALRTARVCYDHLAGEWGVRLYDALLADGRLDAPTAVRSSPPAAAPSSPPRASTSPRLPHPAGRSAAPASTGASAGRISPGPWGAPSSTMRWPATGCGACRTAGRSPSRRRASRPSRLDGRGRCAGRRNIPLRNRLISQQFDPD